MRNFDTLKSLLSIDRGNLEEELIQQSQLFFEVAEQYVESATKRDTAKHIAEKLAAELAAQYRTSSTDKVTENKVSEHVACHPAYVDQYKFYLQYKAEAERWSALREAFDQRTRAIRDLVSLLSIGYWNSGLSDTNSSLIQSYARKYKEKHINE